MDYANAEKILSVSDLVIKFNLRGRVLTAIRGISMDIYKGERDIAAGRTHSTEDVRCAVAADLHRQGYL